MKTNKLQKIISIAALSLLLFAVFSACNEKLESDNSVNKDHFQTVEIKVDGMTCTGCEKTITNAIMELDGINHAKLSHIEGNAIVEFDKTKTTEKAIKDAIISTGYKVVE